MIARDQLLREIARLDGEELELWIARGWVRPDGEPGAWRFEEIDRARIRLICEMRDELAIGEEAMPVVLGLLDQVYGLRRTLSALAAALKGQSPEVRRAIAGAIAGDEGGR